jgi:predicted nucleic acid-binding Zn ribbon protein
MVEKQKKCAHPTCDCMIEDEEKYCSEYCRNAEKSGVAKIGCGCEHSACR